MFKRAASLGVVVLLALLATAVGADERDILVTNQTGEPVFSLFISPIDSDDWEEDILGVDVLEDGASVMVEFSGYDDTQCEFDILAANEDGDEWLLPGVDLCTVVEVVITAKYIRPR